MGKVNIEEYQLSTIKWYAKYGLNPELGFDINEAYNRLSILTSCHPKCECKFEVVEIGES